MVLSKDTINAQKLINSGQAWRMEGATGRACMMLIREGDCMLGMDGHNDYWGNYVPSRDEVAEETKGSIGWVVRHHSVDYAQELAKVGSDVL